MKTTRFLLIVCFMLLMHEASCGGAVMGFIKSFFGWRSDETQLQTNPAKGKRITTPLTLSHGGNILKSQRLAREEAKQKEAAREPKKSFLRSLTSRWSKQTKPEKEANIIQGSFRSLSASRNIQTRSDETSATRKNRGLRKVTFSEFNRDSGFYERQDSS